MALMLARLLQCIGLGRASLGILAHLIVTLSEIYLRPPCFYSDGYFNEESYCLRMSAQSNGGIFLVLAIILLTLEHSSYQEANAIVRAQKSAQAESILQDLLSLHCDAIVRLDDLLRIDQGASKLAAMLLRQADSSEPLLHRCFSDFLHPDSQASFLEHMRGRELGEDPMRPAQMLPLSLLDSLGNEVKVHVSLCSVKDVIEHKMHHLIGISSNMEAEGWPDWQAPP